MNRGMGSGLLFVTLLAAFSAAAILTVRELTDDGIEQRRQQRLHILFLESFEGNIERDSKVEELEISAGVELLTRDGQQALLVRGAGLWGPMEIFIAIDPDTQTIHRLSVLHHRETPGIGSRITEERFLSRFIGVSESSLQEIDLLSGASKSSAALIALCRGALEEWQEWKREGG